MPKHLKNTPKQCASNKEGLCSNIVNATKTLKTKTHSSNKERSEVGGGTWLKVIK
jgi:hypothetical protein